MANDLGEYKVVITADYSQLAAQMQAVADAVSNSAKNISSQMSGMASEVKSQVSGITSATKSSMQESSGAIKKMGEEVNNINLDGVSSSTERMKESMSRSSEAMRSASSEANILSSTLGRVGSNLQFMVAGGLTAGLLAIPAALVSVSESTEALNAKIRQNLELSDTYHNNNQRLNADMQTLNTTAQTYAVGFGTSINDVQEAMQILSRRFKDVGSIQYLTSVAMTMSKLDMVDMKKSAQDLEAVMLQFGLNADGTRQFLNDFTIAVHTARVTGTDLLDALERSGSAFKGFNMNTRESIAAVAALSTETARTGSTIGQAFKSIASNFDTKNAIKALEAYNIKLYDVQEDGTKIIRKGANIFAELQGLFSQLDDEGKRKLAMSLSGGKYQVNQMMAFLADANSNFSSIMNEMKNKSSDEMTQELLKTSMGTFQTKMAQFKASMQVLAQTLGNALLPTLKNIAVAFTGTAMLMQKHSATIIAVGKAVIGLGLAYAGVRGVMIAYAGAEALVAGVQKAHALATMAVKVATELAKDGIVGYTEVAGACSGVEIAAAGASGILAGALDALTISIYSIPIAGWLLLIIAALGVALYEMYENWKSVKAGCIAVWNELVDGVSAWIEVLLVEFWPITLAVYAVYEVFQWLANNLEYVWGIIKENFHTGVLKIQGYMHSISMHVTAAKDWVVNAFNEMVDGINAALPGWGTALANALGQLWNFAQKVFEIAARIKNAIRSMLHVSAEADSGGGDDDGGDEDPYAKAQRMADEAFENIKNMDLGAGGSGGGGSTPNAIPAGGGGGRGGSGGSGGGGGGRQESPYKQAEEAEKEAVAEAKYQSEAVNHRKFTSNDELYIYNTFLAGVEKSQKENSEFLRGQYTLQTKWQKEQLDLQKSQMERQLAEKKLSQQQYYAEEIEMLKKEAAQTLIGSKEREDAEKKVLEAIKKRDEAEEKVQQKEEALNRKYIEDTEKLMDKTVEYAEKLGFITEQEKNAYDYNRNESDFGTQKEDNRKGIAKTAAPSRENEMLAAYQQYLDARSTAERKAATESALLVSSDREKTLDFLTKATDAWEKYESKKMELEEKAYDYSKRYETALLSAYSSSLEKAMEDTLNKTNSFAQNIQNIFKSLYQAISKQFATDFAQKWTKGLSQLVLGTKSSTNQIGTAAATVAQQVQQKNQTLSNNLKTSTSDVTTKFIASTTQRATADATMNQQMQASSTQTKTTALANIGLMMTQMLEAMAIMYVLSSLFGGGGSSSSTSTSTVSLGRNPASYYSTPSTIQQKTTVPSFDIGAYSIPDDMLAMVHKDEMVIPAGLSDNIRSLGSNNASNNQAKATGAPSRALNMTSSMNVSTIDSKGFKRVLDNYKRDLATSVKTSVRNGYLSPSTI